MKYTLEDALHEFSEDTTLEVIQIESFGCYEHERTLYGGTVGDFLNRMEYASTFECEVVTIETFDDLAVVTILSPENTALNWREARDK